MGMRIRVLSGCLAIGATAVILTGTAAHATSLAGHHPTAVVTATTKAPSPNCSTENSYGNNWNGGCQSQTPYPTPTCTCKQSPPPPPTYSPPPTVTVTPTQTQTTPAPQATSQTAVAPSSSPPASAPQTGGGGSIGGGDGPLAAGGVAIALVAGLIGTFAYRRWRQTRSPAA